MATASRAMQSWINIDRPKKVTYETSVLSENMYYKVVISGADIFFENYGNPVPVIGFITCRLIEASSEELAIATIKRDILVHWNQSFNADRKMGMPRLVIEHIVPFKGLIKPKSKQDYYWFTSDEHKQQQLDKFIKSGSRWLWWKKA
ncbi:MAG TPA: hypothetical protein VLE50_10615 [Cellvibrio sp.]|nr:hypothetical protein [Cellvibrio sp.]